MVENDKEGNLFVQLKYYELDFWNNSYQTKYACNHILSFQKKENLIKNKNI